MGMRRFPVSVRRLYNDLRRLYENVRRLYWYEAVIFCLRRLYFFFLKSLYYAGPSWVRQKSRIRETKHLSTDADSSTDAIGRWTKAKSATKKKLFLARRF